MVSPDDGAAALLSPSETMNDRMNDERPLLIGLVRV
jgi:hypothetical protein